MALVVALSGSAYAVSSTINGNELKNRSVAGVKLERHTLTAAEIDKSKLGLVPSAAIALKARELGGIAPSGFIHGTGHVAFARLVLNPVPGTSDQELLKIPGFVDVQAACSSDTNPPKATLTYTNISSNTIDYLRTIVDPHSGNPVTVDGIPMSPGEMDSNSTNPPFLDILRFGYGSGTTARVAVITAWFYVDPVHATCRVDAEADYSR